MEWWHWAVGGVVLILAELALPAFVLVWFLIQRTRRLEITVREAEEFAALGTLAANLAHQIRNPLNSINLNLELLEEDVSGQDTEVTGSLAKTRREVDRLARLVSDFLSYARPSEAVLTEIRVRALFEDVLGLLRAEAASMGVHLRIAPDAPDAVLVTELKPDMQILNR